jgi:hypothetical protein
MPGFMPKGAVAQNKRDPDIFRIPFFCFAPVRRPSLRSNADKRRSKGKGIRVCAKSEEEAQIQAAGKNAVRPFRSLRHVRLPLSPIFSKQFSQNNLEF